MGSLTVSRIHKDLLESQNFKVLEHFGCSGGSLEDFESLEIDTPYSSEQLTFLSRSLLINGFK